MPTLPQSSLRNPALCRIKNPCETVKDTKAVLNAYEAERAKHPHIVVKAGDIVPVKGIQVQVVTAAGVSIEKPLPGAGQPNPVCSSYQALDPDEGENAHSVGFILTYGKFRLSEASLCRQYCVMELSLFGSAAHGEMRAGSDIDILLEFLPDAEIDVVDYAGLMLELERLPGRKVDLVSKNGLKLLDAF